LFDAGPLLKVAKGGTGVGTSTGSGNNVLSTSPTLVTPILGTPTSATLTNATGLPIATGVSGLGTGVATFLATPSSANLRSALTDETGTGSAVFATSPTLVTPALGTPSSAVLTNATGLPNAGLVNSSITIGGTAIALGASSNALANDITVYGVTVGRGAGSYSNNTAVGGSALAVNSVGEAIVAIGKDALLAHTTNNHIVAVGYQALKSDTIGYYSVAVGSQSLFSNISGANNTAVGYQAGYSNTGADNTFVGYQSGFTTTTGTQNVYVGRSAGAIVSSSTGSNNAVLGFGALVNLTSGSNNIAIGTSTLQANTTASNITAVGYQAGYSQTTGSGGGSVFVGYRAGYSGNGYQQTILGNDAGLLSTGSNNTFIGMGSGSTMTSGTGNTILGRFDGNQDGLDIRTLTNYIVLSDGNGARQITMREGESLALDSAIPQTGTGITFPATQSASSNANTLDDYEEGTWTPAYVNIGTGTYTTQFGRYTKVGRLVTIECYLVLATLGTASGGVTISGLPFACTTTSTTAQMWTNSFASLGQNVVGLVNNNTLLDLYSIPASGSITGLVMSDLTGTSNIVFNFSYSVS
jgi:hypothetical protein